MKKLMKNTAKFLAFVFGLAAAQAFANGDIYELRPCLEDGTVVAADYYASAANPVTSGDVDLYFMVRLIEAKYDGNNTHKPWYLKPSSLAVANPDVYSSAAFWPSVSVVVGNELRTAEMVAANPRMNSYGNFTGFTDLIFKFTTKTGDIALPCVVLALADGSPANVASGSSGVPTYEFKLNPSAYWTISNDDSTSLSFSMYEVDSSEMSAGNRRALLTGPDGDALSDYTLAGCNFYVKTVQFNGEVEGQTTPWRTIHEGGTEPIEAEKSEKMCLTTVGSALSEGEFTYYVWVDDESKAYVHSIAGAAVVPTDTFLESDGTTVTKHVGKVTLSGSTSESDTIAIYGVTAGTTCNLVLSPWPQYRANAANTILTDTYKTIPIAVTDRKPSSIEMTVTKNVTATSDYLKYVGVVTVKWSDDQYPNAVAVTVTPEFTDADDAASGAVWTDYFRIATTVDSTTSRADELPTAAESAAALNFSLAAGDTVGKTFYILALTADDKTRSSSHHFALSLAADATDFPEQTETGRLPSAKPLYIDAEEPSVYVTPFGPRQGDPVNLSVLVTNVYADTEDTAKGYEVRYYPDIREDSYSELDGKYAMSPSLKKLVKLDTVTGAYTSTLPTYTYNVTGVVTSRVEVVSPITGLTGAYDFEVTVRPVRSATLAADAATYDEGDQMTFTVNISEKHSSEKLYAFLRVTKQDGSDLTDTECFGDSKCVITADSMVANTSGWEVDAGSTTIYVPAQDGTAETKNLRFTLVLATNQVYSSATDVTSRYKLGDADHPSPLVVTINNLAPVIPSDVTKAGFTVNNYTLKNYIDADGVPYLPKNLIPGEKLRITPDITDVEYDMKNELTWTITASHHSSDLANTAEPPDPIIVTNTTATIGSYSDLELPGGKWNVTIFATDKDGDVSINYTFWVNVVKESDIKLSVAPSAETIDETETHATIDVTLPYYDKQNLLVKLTVTPPKTGLLKLDSTYKETPHTGYPDLAENEYYILFRGSGTESIAITELDGTVLTEGQGFTLQAEVVTTNDYDKASQAWNAYYAKSALTRVYVNNVTPEFGNCSVPNSETNAYKVAGGSANPIKWAVALRSECQFDKTNEWTTAVNGSNVTTNGIKVTIDGCQNASVFFASDTYPGDNFYPVFGSDALGVQTVTVSIEDKDGGSPEQLTYYYEIQAAKFLTTVATGPSTGNAAIPISVKYANAAGIGEGHVWVSGGTFNGTESFFTEWNCNLATKFIAYAFGYPVGAVDNGTLNGEKDVWVDSNGNRAVNATEPASGSYYEYGDEYYDSFFYGFIRATEPGGESYIIDYAPQTGTNNEYKAQYNLPGEMTDDEVGYPQTYIEAVFSREYSRYDNMGDINNDGVPDIYAKYEYTGGALSSFDGAAGELPVVNAKNDDADFFPTSSHVGETATAPGAVSDWETSGQAYTALYEIRGYDDGLNYGMFKFNQTERKAGWVSDIEMSDLEKHAFMREIFKRRDALLNKLYTTQLISDGNTREPYELDLITNFLAHVYFAGASRASGQTRFYMTDDDIAAYTNYLEVVTTNVEDEVTTITTNLVNAWIRTYRLPYAEEDTAVTNFYGEAVSNTLTGVLHTPNPSESLSFDAVDYGALFNYDFNGEWREQQKWAKLWIDYTWRNFELAKTWGFTVENRTDPTVEDTDGDGMPDGYEYYMWYSAMVGTGTNEMTGCRFNLADVESYDDIITAEEIRDLYNPNIAHSWTSADTDNDGLYDLEEFLIGTSPVHWDTDRDGLSDLYEVVYNINPMSAAVGSNGAYNGDGDFMAFRKNPDGYTYSIYAVDNNGTQELWAIYSREAVVIDTNQTTQVVTGRGCKVAMLAGNYIPVTENTTSNNLVTTVRKEVLTSVAVTNAPLTLYHYQVKKYFGFDPRTGWYSDGAGYASARYGTTSSAGTAQNTSQFTAINEFLLMKYRYIVGLENAQTDQENIKAGKTTMYNIILARTTNPSPDFSDKTWGDSETVRAQTQHGADTDGDGVPDGWELYVGVSPNHKFTIARGSTGYDALYWGSGQNAAMNFVRPGTGEIAAGDAYYTDGMSLVREYAGTDSCGNYSACSTVYANHPSQTGSVVEKWFNKFMPTDPYDDDTDGDGLNDGAEGRDWTGSYTINRWGQDGNRSKDNLTINGVIFHMFYGSPSDTGSTCIAGGGYNPCSIDTDADALPDLWEHQYTGLVFKNDEIMTEANSGEGNLVFPRTTGVPGSVYDDIRAAVSALGWWEKNITNDVWHVVMGMDGTVADAYSETGLTSSDRDWDGDGLQNWQEYMVQALRHLRYDDWKTPLLGRDIPAFNRYTGEYEDGSWNGDKGFLKISYAEPVSTNQYATLEELGYKNFVAYIQDNNNYLRELGYFAAPPREWDHAALGLHYYYMLPPTCSRPAGVTSSTNPVLAQDENLNLLWGYAQEADYETGYILAADYAGTPFAGDIPTEVYDPAYTYQDGEILFYTNSSEYATVVVENDPDDPSVVYLDRVLLVASRLETVYHVASNATYRASGYVGTDPRLWDTDEDGMDDYYELFHGLNPILGSIGNINTTTITNYDGSIFSSYYATDVKDVIADAYGNVSGMRNGWVGWDNAERPAYDPMRFPWMMGEGMCDADGDGLRNNEEALSANLTAPNTYHTDPTPLWMTDATGSETNYVYRYTVVSTNVDKTVSYRDPATGERVYKTTVSTNVYQRGSYVSLMDTPSYVGLYYDNFLSYASLSTSVAFSGVGSYFFSFEENEGYDSDNDWRSDDVEMRKTVEKTSDPQNAVDLPRRQSIWFGGASEPGVALTYEDSRRSTYGYDLFKQFTVEAWVRPEEPASGADQYIVSRASNYAGWDYANSNSVIRMNFALGVDASGNLFGEMQNSTDSSFRLTAGTAEANVWTHLAATFDGTTFRVYVNGAEAVSMPTKLIPANGVIGVQQDPQFGTAFPYEHFSYDAVPGITILGGRAAGADAFDVQLAGNASSWNGIATDFFKGSVAEVRFWDGARTAEDILADRDVRFTSASVKALRDNVYNQFRYGARRTYGNLDPELIQHYGFDSLPGATEKGYVVQEPAGFASGVIGSVRNPDTGATISDSLKVGWWSKIAENTAVGSVYSSPHVVPWIENTVAHLPTLCGSVADSVFWSENFAGYTPSEFHQDGSDNPLSKFDIVNTMNPYNLVSLHDEEANLRRKLYRVSLSAYAGGGNIPDGQSVTNNATYRKYLYDTRMAFNGVTDLVPLGSAFAKRLTESWDGEGPEDAWTRTTDGNSREGDLADNGIPQWAIDAGYTADNYKAALAEGLLPDGSFHAEFATYANNADTNGNNIPDWWERYFGIEGCDPNGDPDNDGLSNFQEYLISFGDYSVAEKQPISLLNLTPANKGMHFLDPTNAHSPDADGNVAAVVDYFLKPDFSVVTDERVNKNSYYGEMVTDHDFMETWWETYYNPAESNPYVYDPHLDADGDGWSNWSELRAQYNENTWVVTSIETNLVVLTFDLTDPERSIWAATNQSVIAAVEEQYHDGTWHTHEYIGYPGNWYTDAWFGSSLAMRYTVIHETPILAYGGMPQPNISLKIYGADESVTNGVTLAAYTGSTLEAPDATFSVTDAPVNGTIDTTIPGIGLKQGLNTFIATTSDGKIGIARNVDVGFDSAKVEMTLAASDLYFTLSAATNSTGLSKVEIVRYAANDEQLAKQRRVYVKSIDLAGGKTFTPAELVRNAYPDFDWARLASDLSEDGVANVRSVMYKVYVDGEEQGSFERSFAATRAVAIAVAPVNDAPVYSASPTFRFTSVDSTVSAYRLQVAAEDGAVVWDSGAVQLPCAKPYTLDYPSVWEVTAALYADCFATTNGSPVFADGANYKWRVALLNAKYPEVSGEEDWSAWSAFNMDAGNSNQNPDTQTGYGNLAAAVRYYGAGVCTDLSGSSNIVVEVYATPDFTEQPVSRTLLADLSNLDSQSDIVTTNCALKGVAPGKVYLLAYIDSNNNGKRDAWESWGYANGVDDNTQNRYTPKAIVVTDEKLAYPSATIYIEDCDLNQNEIPDILEENVAQSDEEGATVVDSDGDGLSDADESDFYGTNPYDADTDDDGIPDGYEVATGGDPLTADADTAGKGDYMAYAEVEAYVFETNGVAYVLNVDKGLAYETAAIGGANGTLVATSLVDGFSLADIAGTVTNAFSKRSVVLVHSAVNDWFGYDSTTARDPATLDVSLDGESTNDVSTVLGPNTVPFSAFWKYFTTEFYLPAHGVELDEPMTVASLDYEANGLPDGWELYVKYAAGSDPDKTDDEYRDDLEDGTDPTAEDTDGDGIPDNEEREIGTDPRTPDADTALEGDVMAYAELKRPVVTFEGMCGEGVREVVIMEGTVPSVGQIVNAAAAANLTMRNAYVYGTQSNYVWGVGMEFTVADGEVWRVLEVRPSETVALVHSQVYDAYGFNPRTANATVSSNEWASVNSKAFTALDKTLVTRYFQAIGMTAEADDWKKYALKADTVDSNGDGIADGWELYVMFGPSGTDSAAGTSPADAKVSPWMSAADANDPGYTPDGGGLAVVDEYDEGNSPTDPWSVYSLDSTIDDRYLKLYHLKGDDAGSDYDGDGLSNYAEYLISEVFHFADVDPENPTSGDGTLDYFKKFGELYLGELFSDHDQTGDDWEAKYEAGDIDGVDYAARGIYNPSLDLDRDGWSNYAEYRAGTDPSVSVAPAFDSYKTVEYPVPVVELDLVYNGSLPDGTITVKAWSDESDVNGGYALGAPDAVWTISSNGTANAESEKFIGLKPEGVRTYYLGPGGVKAGTFKLCVMDRNFVTGTLVTTASGEQVPMITGYGKASNARWYIMAIDHNGEIRSSGGRFAEDATFGTIDTKTGRVTLDFSNELFEQMLVGSPSDVYGSTTGNTTTSGTYDFLDLENAYVMLAWEPAGVSGGITGKYFLSDATGHLREGKNTFTIEVDTEQADTDQVSTLTSRASLYAVVRGVDVGWAGARVKAELTDFSPITPRIDLWRPVADRTESVITNDMRVYATEASNKVNRTVASSARERVRVVRYAINGYPSQQSWENSAKVVYDRYRLNTGRTDLTELDFLSDGEFDIDWDTFRSEIVVPTRITSRTGMVTNMCYLVVFGEGDTGWRDSGSGNTVNAHTALITRRFDRERVAANDFKVDGTQYGARPTFSWRIDAENPYTAQYGSSYTAFQLVIQNTGDAVVYDSGIQRMPVRNAAGEYVWTAPVCVGDLAVAAPYAPAGHFYARVMLYNAKFNEYDSDYFSNSVQFSTAVGQQQEINDHGYSSIKAAVKYAGHSVVLKKYADLTTLLGKVRVQAFPTADFTGEPLASAVVTNAVDAIADNAPNAVLRGLAANGSYYIRAFIDMDGDGKLSDFEPWGCCKTPVVLSSSLQSAPVVGVWMEDADTDGDWYPDAYEYATYDGWASGESLGGTVWDDIKGNRVTATKLGVLQQTTIDGEGVVYLLKDGAATTNAISGSLPGVSLTALQTKKYVQMLFNGVLAQNNITDINEAAKARITPDSLKITSMVLDRESKKVVMTVNAEVASSIAGTVVAKYFYFKGSDAKKVNVTVEVYKKNTLMDAEWKLVASVPKTIESDKDDIVEVPLGDEIDLSSGFFKVEAVEADAGE